MWWGESIPLVSLPRFLKARQNCSGSSKTDYSDYKKAQLDPFPIYIKYQARLFLIRMYYLFLSTHAFYFPALAKVYHILPSKSRPSFSTLKSMPHTPYTEPYKPYRSYYWSSIAMQFNTPSFSQLIEDTKFIQDISPILTRVYRFNFQVLKFLTLIGIFQRPNDRKCSYLCDVRKVYTFLFPLTRHKPSIFCCFFMSQPQSLDIEQLKFLVFTESFRSIFPQFCHNNQADDLSYVAM